MKNISNIIRIIILLALIPIVASAQYRPLRGSSTSVAGSTYTFGDSTWKMETVGGVTKVFPYAAKKGADPGYPYFYGGTDAPTFTNRLNLDGPLYATFLSATTNITAITGTSTSVMNGVQGNSTSGNGVAGQSVTGTGIYADATGAGWGAKLIGKTQTDSLYVTTKLVGTSDSLLVREGNLVKYRIDYWDILSTTIMPHSTYVLQVNRTGNENAISCQTGTGVGLTASATSYGYGVSAGSSTGRGISAYSPGGYAGYFANETLIDTLNIASKLVSTGDSLLVRDGNKVKYKLLGNLNYTAIPGADHTTSGDLIAITAATTQAIGDVVYIASTGKATLCDADAIATCPYALAIVADASISADASGKYLTKGTVRDDSWNWTIGGLIYVAAPAGSAASGSTLTQAAPSGANNVILPVGVALSADVIYFFGGLLTVEHL